MIYCTSQIDYERAPISEICAPLSATIDPASAFLSTFGGTNEEKLNAANVRARILGTITGKWEKTHQIAERLDASADIVSKCLCQLRDAGKVEQINPTKNRYALWRKAT